MLQKFSFREKIALLLGLMLVILGGYYFFLYSPLQERYDDLRQEKETARIEYEETVSVIEEIPRLEERAAELERELGDLEAGPALERPEDVIGILSRGSLAEDLELINYQPREAEEGTYISLEVEGRYHALLEFVMQIYARSHRISVEELYAYNTGDRLEVDVELHIDDID